MTKAFLALGAAAVALSATPAMADRHDNHGNRHHARACAKWRNHHCVRWANHGYRVSNARHAMWRTGYRFGPRYPHLKENPDTIWGRHVYHTFQDDVPGMRLRDLKIGRAHV